MINKKILSVFIFSTLALSACGSGGSSSVDGSANSAVGTSPTWIQGVFADEDSFKNRCETPRTGVDINGKAYPDQAGSKLLEKHWLRSWSNNTYLWYDEIIDNNIEAIDDPVEYFETLKTYGTSPSGRAKDRFHFSQNTADYQQLVSNSATLGYGARFILLESSPPREGRIAYIEPNSPAANAGLSRGAQILEIDGVDFINGSDTVTLNNGLFPEVDNEAHTFKVLEIGQTTPRTVVLRAEVVTSEPVKNTRVIDTPSGKIAYLALNTFATVSAEAALIEAFNELSSEAPDDLVLDLRYNGGGYLSISAELGYMIAGSALTANRIYGKATFNDKHPVINPVTGNAIQATPFYDTSSTSVQLPSLNLNKVYILSSGRTCSASEALINGLRGIDVEVVLIGGTTCGKPYGFYSTDNCGTTYSTIQIREENAKGFGDYADGFSPQNVASGEGEFVQGCQVSEDFMHDLGNEQEVMLKAALDYRNSSICPPLVASRSIVRDTAHDLRDDPRIIKRELLEQIRLDALQFGSR